jgi:hypothetical protein
VRCLSKGSKEGRLNDVIIRYTALHQSHIEPQCDQIQPICSRCERRGLPCIGGGIQRFIFKAHDIDKMNLKSRQSSNAISQMPSSDSTKVTMSLVNKLETRHLRFEINWAHGSFMDDLPRRVGHSEALAAATEAFMLAIPCRDVSYTLSRRRLRSYTAALTATRLALLTPVEAYSLNTLCSVYLLWICQVPVDPQFCRLPRRHRLTIAELAGYSR